MTTQLVMAMTHSKRDKRRRRNEHGNNERRSDEEKYEAKNAIGYALHSQRAMASNRGEEVVTDQATGTHYHIEGK